MLAGSESEQIVMVPGLAVAATDSAVGVTFT